MVARPDPFQNGSDIRYPESPLFQSCRTECLYPNLRSAFYLLTMTRNSLKKSEKFSKKCLWPKTVPTQASGTYLQALAGIFSLPVIEHGMWWNRIWPLKITVQLFQNWNEFLDPCRPAPLLAQPRH